MRLMVTRMSFFSHCKTTCGCPYAKGASGNVATEDVLYMLKGMGIETGIDLDKILAASRFISDAIDKPAASKVALAMMGRTAAE